MSNGRSYDVVVLGAGRTGESDTWRGARCAVERGSSAWLRPCEEAGP